MRREEPLHGRARHPRQGQTRRRRGGCAPVRRLGHPRRRAGGRLHGGDAAHARGRSRWSSTCATPSSTCVPTSAAASTRRRSPSSPASSWTIRRASSTTSRSPRASEAARSCCAALSDRAAAACLAARDDSIPGLVRRLAAAAAVSTPEPHLRLLCTIFAGRWRAAHPENYGDDAAQVSSGSPARLKLPRAETIAWTEGTGDDTR